MDEPRFTLTGLIEWKVYPKKDIAKFSLENDRSPQIGPPFGQVLKISGARRHDLLR
jgi:hypothetical protein